MDRFAGTGLTWAAPGGAAGLDFAESVSGELAVVGLNEAPYTMVAGALLLADLADWQSRPDRNFGWFWLSGSEGLQYTARSFGSREGASPPRLRLDYSVPEPAVGSLLVLGLWLLIERRRNVAN